MPYGRCYIVFGVLHGNISWWTEGGKEEVKQLDQGWHQQADGKDGTHIDKVATLGGQIQIHVRKLVYLGKFLHGIQVTIATVL